MKTLTWPAWFSSPTGKSEIFESAGDVPAGWTSGAEKQSVDGGKPAKTPEPEKPAALPASVAPPVKPDAPSSKVELDTGGWPWLVQFHASSKSKTKGGYWRMKVGVARPDPKPGYPLDL
jgi:hypothetical protein